MLKEIRKYNNYGLLKDYFYLLDYVKSTENYSLDSINNIFTNYGLSINAEAIVLMLSFLDLTVKFNENISFSLFIKSFKNYSFKIFQAIFLENVIKKMFEYRIFNNDCFKYSSTHKGIIFIRQNFDFKFAGLRNFLFDNKMFIYNKIDEKILVSNKYVSFFEKHLMEYNKKTSLEKLKTILLNKEKVGEIAESFVIEYENRKLLEMGISEKVKYVSPIDVSAGYDILSKEYIEGYIFHKFIEVKAIGDEVNFFLSQNEMEKSSILADRYYIYLVEITKICDSYNPIIIKNPYLCFKKNEGWFLTPDGFHVKKRNKI